jgi:hypothetical protein
MCKRVGRLSGILSVILCSAAWLVSWADAAILLDQNFNDPLPGSTVSGPATYVAVNDPSPGWQVQGGSATDITLTAGVDDQGVGGSQALFAIWDMSTGTMYSYNQTTIYGIPGPTETLSPSNVRVSLDVFVSGYENDSEPIDFVFQTNGDVAGESSYQTTVTNDAYKHIEFTLNQGNAPETLQLDMTTSFNFRIQHGAGGFGFDDGNVMRIDNVLIETIEGGGGLAGDFNGNNAVENADLTLLLNNWAQPATPVPAGWTGTPQPTAPAIDNDELTALLNNWGQTLPGSGSNVPEPAAWLLGLVATFGLGQRWRPTA